MNASELDRLGAWRSKTSLRHQKPECAVGGLLIVSRRVCHVRPNLLRSDRRLRVEELAHPSGDCVRCEGPLQECRAEVELSLLGDRVVRIAGHDENVRAGIVTLDVPDVARAPDDIVPGCPARRRSAKEVFDRWTTVSVPLHVALASSRSSAPAPWAVLLSRGPRAEP